MKLRTYRGSSSGFTLVEIMLVVATIALLASIAMPGFFRSRKRAQATRILEDLRLIDHAMQLYTMEFHCSGSEIFGPDDAPKLKKYIKTDTALYNNLPNDMLGNPITFGVLNGNPHVSLATFENYQEVAPAEFWSPYNPE